MSIEDIEVYGVQNDGEPAVVETIPEPEAKPEATTEETTEVKAEGETEEDKTHKKTGSARAREALQREREERIRLEAELKVYRELGKAPASPVAPSVDPNEPNESQFEKYEDFRKAEIAYGVKKALAEERQNSAQTQIKTTWEQKKDDIRAIHPDIDEVFENTLSPAPAVAEVLYTTPKGAEIGYYLATHEDEYEKINKMSPALALMTLGKIEDKLASATPKTKPTSNAPRPPDPVKSSVTIPTPSKRAGTYEVY